MRSHLRVSCLAGMSEGWMFLVCSGWVLSLVSV